MSEVPCDNSEYSKREYWDQRYTNEDEYDWLPSIYPACVQAAFDSVEKVYEEQHRLRSCNTNEPHVIKVLHLGVGNSNICVDLYRHYTGKYSDLKTAPYQLVQVAMDYSEVVLEKMRLKHANLPNTHWLVADVRDLKEVRRLYGPSFDLVIDKCTMDALQTDKANPRMEEDIDKMLHEVSLCFADRCLTNSTRYGQFIQVTWEIPYFRLYYTLRKESDTKFAWGTNTSYRFLGDSDLYRLYIYEVQQ
ncbi:unnamed protein product [Phytomonas sp. Hart1]|nr:unnamed protein product [Phytomonas sp. Hart1]|eukprot:CCW66640.1 unnamed protein product [Phytomonas sp. isolate Hart1]